MAELHDTLIIGSDNKVTFTLAEDGVAITASPTEIAIYINKQNRGDSASIIRTPTGDGVTFSAGVVEITPRALTEDLSALVRSKLYRVKIRIKTAQDTAGVVYGDDDSDDRFFWTVRELVA